MPNPRSHSMRLAAIPFGGIKITTPINTSPKIVKRLLTEKAEWLRRALQTARLTEQQSIAFFAQVDEPAKQVIRVKLVNRLDQLARKHGFVYARVTIRDQHTRWGSCSYGNNISLNRKLIFLPAQLQDYVLLHELAHTRQRDHSPRFWAIITDILGQESTIAARRSLHDYGFLFYPPPKY